VKPFLLSLIAGSLAVIAYVSPPIGAALVVVGLSAFTLRQMSEREEAPSNQPPPMIDNPTSSAESGSALDQARRELALPINGSAEPIDVHTQLGRIRLSSGHRNQSPFVSVQWFASEETEMTFIIRRTQSLLGLARVVDNTPVHGSRIEYRLRSMEIAPPLDRTFTAGSSRPRLFRELLASGFEKALNDGLFDPKYRLEEVCYTGRSMTALFVPAAEPAASPWASDALERTVSFVRVMQSFLAESHIPSAQG
jgi:hypothetical protein